MGRGGKKKKQTEKAEDLGLGTLSISESKSTAQVPSEPSTSQGPSASNEPTKDDELETKKIVVKLEKEATPQETTQPTEVKEEEADGLGLGFGGGKKKQRKKKKNPVSTAEAASEPVPAQAPAPGPTPTPASTPAPARTPAPTQAPAFSQPMQKLPEKEVPPIPEFRSSAEARSAGWGRGQRSWQAPQTVSAPIQQQTSVTFPQQQVQSAPSLAQPMSSFGRGQGRGPQYEPKVQVVGAQQPRPPSVPSTVACRFAIPSKIPGNTVRANRIRVITNYLEMTIQPIKIMRYDVNIVPDRPKKLLPKVFAAAKASKFPKEVIAFDQRKNCYSLNPLLRGSEERCVINVDILDDNDAKMSFEVALKSTGVVDLGTIVNHMKSHGTSLNTPMEAIQCVDVILQQGTLESYVKAGRQFFKRPRNPIDLSGGLEMWTGLFQSAIFTSRAFINIDVAHKGFPKHQNLVDAFINDFRLNPNQPIDRQERFAEPFRHFIKALRVKARIGGTGVKQREYICNEIVGPSNKLTFNITDQAGKPVRAITVAKYFEEKRCRLRYPDLNCIWVGPKDKNIYYPMELLEVTYGQPMNKQLNERQLSTMVREAATPPSERLNKIKEVIHDMKYSANPGFKHFKMEIASQFFQVDAKVLEAPKLNIGAGRPVDPRKGSWIANRFLRASALEAWGLIAIDVNADACNCDRIIDMIMRVGNNMGMPVNKPSLTKFNVMQRELRSVLLTAQDKQLNFMFIIVSARDKDAYHKVKRMAELEVGILTQCIKEMTAKTRMNDQTIRNILLKVNSKLMGINQALDKRSMPQCIANGGVMIVGADVTHPSPDQKSVPSIAAVTASIDGNCFLYNIEMSVQTSKHEIIVDFENMMFDHLNVYRKHQNALPKKIFVFRDGVSEGQFSQVMNSELVAVHRAYSRLDPKNKPEILFLLVQKRHHTRFFSGESNPQNVEPGTVVDSQIVHPKELDFYMVSHQAIKGTARPTRYHAVCNDGHIPSDEVEQLTFYLCHLYSRCTRSVSYPTPTYYAHLACSRAKSLTYGVQYNNADLEKQPIRLRVMDRMLQCSRMFFV